MEYPSPAILLLLAQRQINIIYLRNSLSSLVLIDAIAHYRRRRPKNHSARTRVRAAPESKVSRRNTDAGIIVEKE